jgi:hypothetical protein
LDGDRSSSVEATGKVNRDDQSSHATPLKEEVNEEKLRQVLGFIYLLRRTPSGAAELERRAKVFGECKRIEGEASGQFCARLRHWLDRDMPETKSSRHARRQDDD